MCGIVGYIGPKQATRVLLEGLRRLEYRGYDSAGVTVASGKSFKTLKTTQRVDTLIKDVAKEKLEGHVGITHTRWATHGGISTANAHPPTSTNGAFVLVHNGVIENYLSIKKFLLERGYTFYSETDTEVLVNLIDYHYQKEVKTQAKNAFWSLCVRACVT